MLKSKKEWAAKAARALKAPIPKAAELLCGLLATAIRCLKASTNPWKPALQFKKKAAATRTNPMNPKSAIVCAQSLWANVSSASDE